MKRVGRLQELMNGLDCLLLTSPEDIFYYTGYMPLQDDGSLLVVLEECSKLFTSANGFQKKSASVEIITMKKPTDFYDFIKNYKVIGFDENKLLARSYINLKKKGLKLIPSSEIIRKPRMVKDNNEIERIKNAIRITKSAFRLKLNGSENEAASRIDCFFRKNLAEESFETIVASGKNSSNVHHRPSDKKISKNDLVIVDIGARVNGYCSDMTRTFCSSPSKREREIMDNVKTIQGQLIDFIKPGLKMSEVQKEYEKLLRKSDAKCFHLFGHGVGLDVHERPSSDDVLEENMVITVEPGIYKKNFGGCRIEDMILIKKEKVKLLS